ncbi:MAG: oligopeptidase B [Gemmatimonadetes bacterium 13_1_40CM_66_11]|nr:MAG: oligopeptidase B [Gemmatimonadetes bacterium 13_1_40CM_66_11]
MSARIRSLALAFAALGPGVILAQTPAASTTAAALTPPAAAVRPHRFDEHGTVRIDPYYWLRERDNPEVIRYLQDENAYTKAVMAHTEALQDRLYEELKGRVLQNDQSVPFREGNYFYYTRLVEGKNYPIYARKRGSLSAPEETMVDANALAEGKATFLIRAWEVSSGEDLLAFTADTTGGRVGSIRFKNLRTGEMLPDVVPRAIGAIAWAADNRTLFYTKPDSVTVRPYQVYRHRLGTPAAADQLVYEDTDETYYTSVFKTKSRAYIMIQSSQTMATEYHYVRADQPDAPVRVMIPRERGHEYYANHFGDYFYILSNDHAKNFRLMRTPVARPGRDNWEEVIPHRPDVLLEDFEFFRDYLVLSERKDGLVQLRVRPWSGHNEYYLDFGEPAYLAYVSVNRAFDTPVVRFVYTSLTTPSSTYDYDMGTRQKTLLKRDQILGGFDPANYVTERLSTTARDGARVPVSVVYRKGVTRPAPMLLTGYGSYGASTDPTFSADRLSLLDRGFVFAIAHIRGGSEMGRAWYENGRQLQKKNTFTDFVDVADDLIRRGYTSSDRLFARGASAGGLLMGAVVNLRPELFKGVIAGVPYVDVITTMMDSTIPLTTGEYDEWGNPHDSTFYRYMLSYSPYDNVERKAYPNLLITAGLYDTQVLYVEPAKWTAKLRAMKTDNNRLILRTNMEAGHGGASGRYKRWHDVAFEYAFLLDLAGLGDKPTP